jgi:hypothetical protein
MINLKWKSLYTSKPNLARKQNCEGYKEDMLQYMEINLPPKTSMLFPYEVHVIEYIEILAGYYILRPNLTLASISFLVYM